METHSSEAFSLTETLIRIDSTDPGACEGDIGRFIYDWLSDRQIPVLREEVMPDRYNLMAKIEGKKEGPALVYICHMDTVTVGDGWTLDPFGAEYRQGRIYGRGACDMKSGLACALSAFVRIAEKAGQGQQPDYPFVLIATVDEEDFMRGVLKAIASGWVREDSWVLDTEPTNSQIQVAHKGRTWFEITVTGITAHASTPWKGADAIAAAAEVICGIRRRIEGCESHDDLGKSTVTFGQIEGGYRPYVVPDACTVWVDMRLVPPTDTACAARLVEEAIKEAEAAVPGVKISATVTGDRPYVEKDLSSGLLAALEKVCLDVTGETPLVSCFPGYTDTAVIAGTLNNHNCMSYGPGNLEIAHKPDEYVPCEDILRCEEVLEKLADRILYGTDEP